MTRFDPKRCREHFLHIAGKRGLPLEVVLHVLDKESAVAIDSSECLSTTDLIEGSAGMNEERKAHIRDCHFCNVCIRYWYLKYANGDEFLNVLSSVGDKLRVHPRTLYDEICQDIDDEEMHYCVAEFVRFDTLSAEVRAHCDRCGICSAACKLISNMETPRF